jgi:hypothetical protein
VVLWNVAELMNGLLQFADPTRSCCALHREAIKACIQRQAKMEPGQETPYMNLSNDFYWLLVEQSKICTLDGRQTNVMYGDREKSIIGSD